MDPVGVHALQCKWDTKFFIAYLSFHIEAVPLLRASKPNAVLSSSITKDNTWIETSLTAAYGVVVHKCIWFWISFVKYISPRIAQYKNLTYAWLPWEESLYYSDFSMSHLNHLRIVL